MPEKNISSDLNNLSWDSFRNTPLNIKSQYFIKNSRMFDCLFAEQFSNELLEELFVLADKIRSIASSKQGLDRLQTLLSDKRACLYFAQPSTRTFLSFQNACHILGIKTSDIRSISASSESKGESLEDTLRTIHSYVDLIIIRHSNEYIAEKTAWMLNKTEMAIPIINAGSGPREHPTQALLDAYTIKRAFDSIDGITIAMIGDLKRGRTIRSLTYLLSNYKNIKINYVGADSLKINEDLKRFLSKTEIIYEEFDKLEDGIQSADVIYATRIQDEYDSENESKKIDYTKIYLKKDHLKLIKKDAIIMHPLPRRDEIDPAIDEDSRAMYWQQERNGMWIRTALLAYVFNADRNIFSI